jgi:hypothetical protein
MAHNIRMLAGQHGAARSVDPALSIAFSRDGAGALRITYRRFSLLPGEFRESNDGCGRLRVRPRQVLICPRVLHIDDSITRERMAREGQWSEAIAVGNLNFVEKVKSQLGSKAAHREVIEGGGTYALREQSEAYGSDFTGKNEVLSSENTRFWNENSEFTAI